MKSAAEQDDSTDGGSKASPIKSVPKKRKKKKKKLSYKEMMNSILKSKSSYEEKDKQRILKVTGAGKFNKVIKI
jgi:hypothetical protein